MKIPACLICLLFIASIAFSQKKLVDSLSAALQLEQTDTGKILILYNLSFAYQESKPDSALLIAQQAYFMAKKANFIIGESWALNQMAVAYNNLGNFPKALGYYIQQLKIEEIRGIPENVAIVYIDIAMLYEDAKDYKQAINYAKKADSIINTNKIEAYSMYSLQDIGEIYERENKLDSALFYTKGFYNKAVKANYPLAIGNALKELGVIYFKIGDLSNAAANYRASVPYLESSNDNSHTSESILGLAKIFEQTRQYDSATYYGKKSFDIASANQFQLKSLDASQFLTSLYKQQKNIDSAFVFQEIFVKLKDSVDSREKIKDVQNITTEEELRQKEIAEQKLEELKDRREKLQLLLIGIIIPIFFLLSIIISRKKVHKRLIEFSGIISILLLFEYITLLLHPFIAEKTNHSPFIEIIIFVSIAAVITPTHHRIERWLISKLTQYNFLKHHREPVQPKENVNEEDIIL